MIRVRAEVEPRAGLAAQRRREAAEEILRFDERDLLAVLGERESRGKAADAAADDDRVGQGETSEQSSRGFEVSRIVAWRSARRPTIDVVRRTYRGDAIEVSFDFAKCVHIGECLRGAPEVFELGRRPWVVPDAASADEVAAVVERCPSGALQYRRLDGGADELGPEPPTVVPLRNGPLLVRGRVEVRHDDGTVEVLPRAALCRCGASANKPFCDNSHLRNGFRAPGEVFHIELSPVRRSLDQPIARSEDPRAG